MIKFFITITVIILLVVGGALVVNLNEKKHNLSRQTEIYDSSAQ